MVWERACGGMVTCVSWKSRIDPSTVMSGNSSTFCSIVLGVLLVSGEMEGRREEGGREGGREGELKEKDNGGVEGEG